ncbi:MAG TPA: DUF1579 domain-containing protein, partial [Isosphaeraceae bacterium]
AWCLASTATAQESPPVQEPLPEHKILAADEGTWDATIRMYAGGPDAEPAVSKGSEVNEVLPGGLWVLSKFEGDFGGMKFHGRGQFGYDPAKKKYVGTWLDSISTVLSVLEGEYDAKTKTMTFVGEGYDPGQKAKFTQKLATTTKEDGSRIFTLYMKYEGQQAEVKFMEITYTKRR